MSVLKTNELDSNLYCNISFVKLNAIRNNNIRCITFNISKITENVINLKMPVKKIKKGKNNYHNVTLVQFIFRIKN